MKNESLKKNNITKNTEYLLKSREESKLSFSSKSGITRSTIYKLLNGEVRKLQTTTIEKIADFFGVSAKMLESTDIERLEASEKNLSITGNMNPICVPIIEESNSIMLLNENIGDLILSKKQHIVIQWSRMLFVLSLRKIKHHFMKKASLYLYDVSLKVKTTNL